ncbi:MAG: ABC transporter permease [Elusimicrobiota bacterium]
MKFLIKYVSLIIFVLLWQLFAGYIHPKFNTMAQHILPSPLKVLEMGADLLKRGELLVHIRDSLQRILLGFSIAALLGIGLGCLMGISKPLRDRIKIIIVLLRPVPPFAWIPLGLIWFGIGNAEMIMVIVISGIFPIALHTLYGIDGIDYRLKQAALSLGASRLDLLKKVIFPAVLPEIFSGLRLSLGFCWVVVVGAEMVGSVSGLGYLILDSRNRGLPQMAVLGMVVIGILGLIMDSILIKTKKWLLPWDVK